MLTVSLAPDIQHTLVQALGDAGTNECGGVLMGFRRGDGWAH